MECFKSASDDDYFNDRFFQYVSLRYTPVPCISVGRTAYFRLLFRSYQHGDGFYFRRRGIIKKVYLPKYIFPLSRVISSFTSMLLSMIALFIVIIATDVTFSITIILLPFILVQVLVFCIGMGLLLSVLVVFFRDVQYLYSIFLTAFNYLTPIFYPESLLPEWLRELLVFNPLYNYIKFFRKITVYGQWPTMTEHLICLAFTFCMLVIGLYVFKRKQNDFILYI